MLVESRITHPNAQGKLLGPNLGFATRPASGSRPELPRAHQERLARVVGRLPYSVARTQGLPSPMTLAVELFALDLPEGISDVFPVRTDVLYAINPLVNEVAKLDLAIDFDSHTQNDFPRLKKGSAMSPRFSSMLGLRVK